MISVFERYFGGVAVQFYAQATRDYRPHSCTHLRSFSSLILGSLASHQVIAEKLQSPRTGKCICCFLYCRRQRLLPQHILTCDHLVQPCVSSVISTSSSAARTVRTIPRRAFAWRSSFSSVVHLSSALRFCCRALGVVSGMPRSPTASVYILCTSSGVGFSMKAPFACSI